MTRRTLPLLTLLLVLAPSALLAAGPQPAAAPLAATAGQAAGCAAEAPAPHADQLTPAADEILTPDALLLGEPIFAATECCTSKQQVDCRKQCNAVRCLPRNTCGSDGSCVCLCVCPV